MPDFVQSLLSGDNRKCKLKSTVWTNQSLFMHLLCNCFIIFCLLVLIYWHSINPHSEHFVEEVSFTCMKWSSGSLVNLVCKLAFSSSSIQSNSIVEFELVSIFTSSTFISCPGRFYGKSSAISSGRFGAGSSAISSR